MGLAETFALLREHSSLAEVLRTLEARGMAAPEPSFPSNVVSLCQERRKRQSVDGGSPGYPRQE